MRENIFSQQYNNIDEKRRHADSKVTRLEEKRRNFFFIKSTHKKCRVTH